MISKRFDLWAKDEYHYPMAFGFCPNIVSYLHDEDSQIRPCIIVVPGGGYRIVSPSEGEIVAEEFYRKGYNAFVCTYTINLTGAVPLKDQPLKDLSRAVRFVRKHKDEFCVNPDQIIICGFSAGGHLCGSLCVHFEDAVENNPEYADISNRPDAAILSYPVITSGEDAHRDSFTALLGDGADDSELEYASLEKQVSTNTPPCFLWQTATDELVPVENSYLMAAALKEKGIPFAHHVFSQGMHGLSLANELWASGEYGEPYTMEQIFKIVDAVKSGEIPCDEEGKKALLGAFDYSDDTKAVQMPAKKANTEAAVWPVLADGWLRETLGIIF